MNRAYGVLLSRSLGTRRSVGTIIGLRQTSVSVSFRSSRCISDTTNGHTGDWLWNGFTNSGKEATSLFGKDPGPLGGFEDGGASNKHEMDHEVKKAPSLKDELSEEVYDDIREIALKELSRGLRKGRTPEEEAMLERTQLRTRIKGEARARLERASALNDPIVAKMVNRMMKAGKKSVSERIILESFRIIKEKMQNEPRTVFRQCVENISPYVELKSTRRGGVNLQVPVAIAPQRRSYYALTWLVAAARRRSGRGMAEKLAAEIMDGYQKQGGAFKRREELHELAAINVANMGMLK